MTRYLLTGATGLLGHDIQKVLGGSSHLTALGRSMLDVTDPDAVLAAVKGHEVVINAAAYTAVDDAEEDETSAYAVNAFGARNLAVAAATHGARLVQVSTDYVFRGDATEPYTEDAPLDPISAYGRTKAAGEHFAINANPEGTIIVRTAWLYGAHGSNFVKTMLRIAASRDIVSVVTDQVGQPTWSFDLARQIVGLTETGVHGGVFHATASGSTSWFGLARAAFEEAGLDPARVRPASSSEFVRRAPRPAYSVLAHNSWALAGMPPMRHWRNALHAAMASNDFTHTRSLPVQ